MVDMDNHIARIESIDESSPRAAIAEVMTAVASLNTGSVGQSEFALRGLPDRLQEWLDKLMDKLQKIAAASAEITSLTVSVGTPFNVSVAVTFAKPS
ncbi:MAG TPA: hypothetical protein VG650_01815 [Mycobacteriales bacterium]|nr:hypothetical protein [Mycobacteriales bacterium]